MLFGELFLVISNAEGLAIILNGTTVIETKMNNENASCHAGKVATFFNALERLNVGRNGFQLFE
jgi:hypothetical protein